MSKENWHRVVRKKYVYQNIEEKSFKGIVSLLHIKEVTTPSYKTYKDDINVKIADEDFYWLQIGLENKNYWITVMYDEHKNIIQYYIDITKENVIRYNSDSYFYDLFLDVVLLNDNNDVILLDENELKQALNDKIIDINQYNLAYKVAKEIMELLPKKKRFLEQFSNKYFNILLNKLESEEDK